MLPTLLTVEDVANALGICKTTAYQLIREIRHIRIGRRILVSEADLIDYLKKHSCQKNDKAS
jgi:excisionase family DNA binding protein